MAVGNMSQTLRVLRITDWRLQVALVLPMAPAQSLVVKPPQKTDACSAVKPHLSPSPLFLPQQLPLQLSVISASAFFLLMLSAL